MTSYPINHPCPQCQQKTVVLEKTIVSCQSKACSFSVKHNCPLCKKDLDESHFKSDQRGDYVACSSCQHNIYVKRMAYLINNKLNVNFETRCKICNGPTLNRLDLNLAHRCFFFPKCSGQSNLFGEAKESLVFLDFETSGLEVGRDSVIEIGALKIDQEGDEHTYQSLINPGFPLHPRITQITGITNDMLVHASDSKTCFEELIEFVGTSKIIAHNADFDILWLIHTCEKLSIPLQDNLIICTLKWARASNESRCSLGALTKKYKIGHDNAHRALADAAATKELYFIFENLQTAPRPIESFSHYQSRASQIKTSFTKV